MDDDRDCSLYRQEPPPRRLWFPPPLKPRPRTETDDTPHTHNCVDPTCDGTWTHTPNDAWNKGRYAAHTCPKCGKIQFERADSVEHDVPG